ncbi:MAG: PhzF family phenazine biosynthesis protein [Vicinamibacterales bacterium]
MRYRFFICDVFADEPFGGNQLAVLPDAQGLGDEHMQRIAREFNFSESTFVWPAEHGHTRKVRIFTPTREVPFAGHPNVGTAFALAASGALGTLDGPLSVTFEEKAGLVPISIQRRGASIWCELQAPEPLTLGRVIPASVVASALGLAEDDVVTTAHEPVVASVGLPFVMVELRNRDALARARVVSPGFDAISAFGVVPDVHLYTRSGDDFDIRARMFAPFDGVPEDPATGSANCALVGLLAQLDSRTDSHLRWRIAQGVEMRRPSVLDASAEKRGGTVVATRIGGTSVLVAEGTIEVA